MAKTVISEVEVLRFFETESLDKATVMFNIVADKMQARLHGSHAEGLSAPERRRARTGKTSTSEAAEQSPAE